jgi:hypothetical protein
VGKRKKMQLLYVSISKIGEKQIQAKNKRRKIVKTEEFNTKIIPKGHFFQYK